MKKPYLTRLERWARWMLPRAEADDVIADYREITSDPEMLRGLDKPRKVIRPLAQKKPYYTWLAVFAVMAACVLAVGFCPSALGYPIWRGLVVNQDYQPHWLIVLAVLGAAAALIWFRLYGRKEGRLSRAVPVLLAVCLAFLGMVLWFCWACARDFEGFLAMWGTVKPWIGPNTSQAASYYLLRVAMADGSALIALVGVFALVRARTGDRRWAAVYVLALAAILAALLVLYWTGRMDWTEVPPEEAFRQMLLRCAGIAAVGLAGAGVALC